MTYFKHAVLNIAALVVLSRVNMSPGHRESTLSVDEADAVKSFDKQIEASNHTTFTSGFVLHEGAQSNGFGNVQDVDQRVKQMADLIFENAKASGSPNTAEQNVEKLKKAPWVVWYEDDNAEDGNARVSAVGGLKEIKGATCKTSEIGMLATATSARGKGLAGEISQRLLAKAADLGLASVYSITRVDNYLSLKTQFKSGWQGTYAHEWKGVSTIVGFAITNSGDVYAILLTPAGSVYNPLKYLDKDMIADCGQVARDAIATAAVVKAVATPEEYTCEQLQLYFTETKHNELTHIRNKIAEGPDSVCPEGCTAAESCPPECYNDFTKVTGWLKATLKPECQ